MDAAAKLRIVAKALSRERQIEGLKQSLEAKMAALRTEMAAARAQAEEVQRVLDEDPELTAVARQMMQTALDLEEDGGREVAIHNPGYVTATDKRRLLLTILQDFHRENPEAEGMSYAAIKDVLENRYQIKTASTGMFFRNEIKGWETRGGNKNKQIVLDLAKMANEEHKLRERNRGAHRLPS